MPTINKSSTYFIAVDPGRDKTGIAVISFSGAVKIHFIIESAQLIDTIKGLIAKYNLTTLVIGSGTSSKAKIKLLQTTFAALTIITVDEYRSTDTARKLYFQDNPPKGWKRLIPLGMQIPPVPVDDYAAIIIGKKYLQIKYRDS